MERFEVLETLDEVLQLVDEKKFSIEKAYFLEQLFILFLLDEDVQAKLLLRLETNENQLFSQNKA